MQLEALLAQNEKIKILNIAILRGMGMEPTTVAFTDADNCAPASRRPQVVEYNALR